MREKMGQPVNCLLWKVAVADLHFWDPEVLTVIGPLHNQQQQGNIQQGPKHFTPENRHISVNQGTELYFLANETAEIYI